MSVTFSKMKKVSLKDQVIRELENKILSGELQPGDRLPAERDLALAMGVSRSLINLSVLELESRGFISIVPRLGTFVNDYKKHGTPQMLHTLMNYATDKMDRTLFDSLMDTRRFLENECTRLAVNNAAKEDLDLIGNALAIMEENISNDAFFDGNFSFHQALTAASGNAVYAMIFNSFEKAIRYFFTLFFSGMERREQSVMMHQSLYQALCSRDKAAALDAIHLILDIGIEGLAHVFKQ